MAAKIGVALIGSGLFVQDEHLPAVQANKDLELKAIYSRSISSAQKLSKSHPDTSTALYSDDSSPSSSGTYATLLQRSDIQAVIIALPILVQPTFIREALRAGKHVLAEKPLAPSIAEAEALLSFYRTEIDHSTINFSVAEQLRFVRENELGAQRARALGPVRHARFAALVCVRQDSRYYSTAWRKTPGYQGGFLLDGGVHDVASMRLLLGSEARVKRVSAQTTLLKEYLRPCDTIDAVLALGNGGTAVFSLSYGSEIREKRRLVGCEKGVVTVTRDEVVVLDQDGKETTEDAKDELGGVMLEVNAWVQSLKVGKWDPRQTPEEALADVEILEACLKSGELGGVPVDLKHQF